jgi:hypothetical protein
VIKNKAAWVTRLRSEVVEVEVEGLDDASRDKNRRTPCTKREGENLAMSRMFKQKTAARYPVAVRTKRTGKKIPPAHLSFSSALPGRQPALEETRQCRYARAWGRTG